MFAPPLWLRPQAHLLSSTAPLFHSPLFASMSLFHFFSEWFIPLSVRVSITHRGETHHHQQQPPARKKEGRWWDFSLRKYLPEIYNTWLYRPDGKKKTQKNTIEGERFEWNCIQARSQRRVRGYATLFSKRNREINKQTNKQHKYS